MPGIRSAACNLRRKSQSDGRREKRRKSQKESPIGHLLVFFSTRGAIFRSACTAWRASSRSMHFVWSNQSLAYGNGVGELWMVIIMLSRKRLSFSRICTSWVRMIYYSPWWNARWNDPPTRAVRPFIATCASTYLRGLCLLSVPHNGVQSQKGRLAFPSQFCPEVHGQFSHRTVHSIQRITYHAKFMSYIHLNKIFRPS